MQVDGYSLDAQRDKLRKYAAYEDMVVAREYSDAFLCLYGSKSDTDTFS